MLGPVCSDSLAIALGNAWMHEATEERARSEAVAAERDRLLLQEGADVGAVEAVPVGEHALEPACHRVDPELDALLGAPAEIAIRTF